jgi:hypothetical protein
MHIANKGLCLDQFLTDREYLCLKREGGRKEGRKRGREEGNFCVLVFFCDFCVLDALLGQLHTCILSTWEVEAQGLSV